MYWTNRGDGTVHNAALDGTDGFALVSGQHRPQGMAVSSVGDGDGDLYWANNGDGTIWEADWPGGEHPHPIITGQLRPVGVAVGPQSAASRWRGSTAWPLVSPASDRDRAVGGWATTANGQR